MKFKKFLSVFLAAVMLVSTLSLSAFAAEKKTEFTLVKTPLSDVYGEDPDSLVFMDNGLCYSYATNNFYCFSDSALNDWRDGKKLKAETFKPDLPNENLEFLSYCPNDKGWYLMFASMNGEGEYIKYYVYSLNTEEKTITRTFESEVQTYVLSNGYVVQQNLNGSKLELTFTSPDGKTSSFTTNDMETDENAWKVIPVEGENCVYLYYHETEDTIKNEGGDILYRTHLLKIGINGKAEDMMDKYHPAKTFAVNGDTLSSKPVANYDYCYWSYLRGAGEGYFAFEFGIDGPSCFELVNTKKKTVGSLSEVLNQQFRDNENMDDSEYVNYNIWDLGLQMYGTKVIATYGPNNPVDEGHPMSKYETIYALLDVDDTKSKHPVYKVISDYYKFMFSEDGGKTYYVGTFDGKRGFLNSKGKVLKIFDAAGTFIGDYAPVLEGGEGYLVDRSMNKVSDTISGVIGMFTTADNLFIFNTENGPYLVSYKSGSGSASSAKPAAVSGFEAKTVNSTDVTLSWNESSDAEGYRIQQYIDGKWKTVKTIKKNSTVTAKISSLKANTSYKFRISAYNTADGKKQYGPSKTITVKTASK